MSRHQDMNEKIIRDLSQVAQQQLELQRQQVDLLQSLVDSFDTKPNRSPAAPTLCNFSECHTAKPSDNTKSDNHLHAWCRVSNAQDATRSLETGVNHTREDPEPGAEVGTSMHQVVRKRATTQFGLFWHFSCFSLDSILPFVHSHALVLGSVEALPVDRLREHILMFSGSFMLFNALILTVSIAIQTEQSFNDSPASTLFDYLLCATSTVMTLLSFATCILCIHLQFLTQIVAGCNLKAWCLANRRLVLACGYVSVICAWMMLATIVLLVVRFMSRDPSWLQNSRAVGVSIFICMFVVTLPLVISLLSNAASRTALHSGAMAQAPVVGPLHDLHEKEVESLVIQAAFDGGNDSERRRFYRRRRQSVEVKELTAKGGIADGGLQGQQGHVVGVVPGVLPVFRRIQVQK